MDKGKYVEEEDFKGRYSLLMVDNLNVHHWHSCGIGQ